MSAPDLAPQAAEAPRWAEVRPLAPERYKIQFTVSRETHDKLREAQDLMRHRVPNGDVAWVFEQALNLLLADLRKARHAPTTSPCTTSARGSGRHVPAAVKRAVWTRDDGQCAFVGSQGRCTERGFLEYHHLVPFADGGLTTVDNLELRCRAHNAYEAERWFGMPAQDFVKELPATPWAGAALPGRTEEGHLFAELGLLALSGAPEGGGDELGADVALAAPLLVHATGWNRTAFRVPGQLGPDRVPTIAGHKLAPARLDGMRASI